MHSLSKYKVFLYIIFAIFLVSNIDNVMAECFKYTYKDGSGSFYATKIGNDKRGKVTSEEVDASYCKPNGEITQITGNNYDDNLVSCGDELLTDLPAIVPKIVHIVYLIIQILIPVLIVVFGSMDFVKAVIAQKDDEIKKGQQVFIKRLIAGVIVFFVFAIVKIIVSFAADSEKTRILDCASCIINNNEDCVVQ